MPLTYVPLAVVAVAVPLPAVPMAGSVGIPPAGDTPGNIAPPTVPVFNWFAVVAVAGDNCPPGTVPAVTVPPAGGM